MTAGSHQSPFGRYTSGGVTGDAPPLGGMPQRCPVPACLWVEGLRRQAPLLPPLVRGKAGLTLRLGGEGATTPGGAPSPRRDDAGVRLPRLHLRG
nr:hypothetical protein [Candidatus Freyrarchaeum guaymaensis]